MQRPCLSVGLATVFCLAAGGPARAEGPQERPLAVGDTVPNLETHSIEGMPVSLRPPKGKLLLIPVWDTGADKADDRAKATIVLYRRFHAKGLNVLGICTDGSEDRIFRFSQRWQTPWPQLMDKDEDAGGRNPTKLLGSAKPPFNMLIDSEGKVLATNLKGEEAHATVAKILGAELDDLPMPDPPEPRPERRSREAIYSYGGLDRCKSMLGSAEERKDAEPCRKNLRKISIALTDYRGDHDGQLPERLSGLYPKYLQDESALLCPKDPTPLEGHERYAETKMRCSYLYEFAPEVREWKTQQLGQWGDKVPVVRCLDRHPRPLSLSWGGEIYFTMQIMWEHEFPTGYTLDSNDAKVRKRLGELGSALAKYRKDKGEVPRELKDLHPDYVKDESLFVCPVTGEPFSYQFSASKKGGDGRSYREWKTGQLNDFGDYVPVIRAKGVLQSGAVINLSYGGEIYESPAVWESLFE